MNCLPQNWPLPYRAAAAVGLVLCALLLRFSLMPVAAGAPFVTFYPAMALCFLVCGTILGCLATSVSTLLAYGIFVPPCFDWALTKQGAIPAGFFLLSSIAIGMLIGTMRQRVRSAELRGLAIRQSAILDNDMIGVATIRGRTIVWGNRGLEQLLGFPPGGLAGAPTRSGYYDERDHQAVGEAAYPILMAGGTYRREVLMVTKDGRRIWVGMTGRMLDPATQETLWLFADISPRKQAEAAARAATDQMRQALDAAQNSEARFRLLAENANDMIATMAPDSTVRFVTPAITRILGYTPDEIVGRTTLSLTHPDDIAIATKTFARLIKAGPNAPAGMYQFRGRHKNGTWIWLEGQPRVEFDPAGKPTAFQDVVRDISARKQLEEALHTSQSFLARTSRVAGVGGWEHDVASAVTTWSDETCRLHDLPPGHRPSLAEGIGYYEPEARPVIAKAVEDSIAFGTPWDLELPLTSARGRKFWARAVGTAEFNDGKIVRLVGAFQDITVQRKMALDLSGSNELLKVTLESIGDAVITTDAASAVTWLNPVAEALTQWSNAAARGQPLQDIFKTIDEVTRQPVCMPSPHGTRQTAPDQVVLLSRTGSEYGVDVSVSPLRDADQTVRGMVLVFRDVSEQRRVRQDLAYRATHDALTGLPNRAEFAMRLRHLVTALRGVSVGHAVLFIDLDRFKQVNDSCGHAAGDQLLLQIGALLRGCIRGADTDSVARLGGDEFGMILRNCEPLQATAIAESICSEIDAFSFAHGGRQFSVGASIGLVLVDAAWVSPDALLHAADMACYAAKRAGRNQVHVWCKNDSDLAIWPAETRLSTCHTLAKPSRAATPPQRIGAPPAHRCEDALPGQSLSGR